MGCGQLNKMNTLIKMDTHPTAPKAIRKSNKFDIRWTDEQQLLIRQAAALSYSNPTSFIRDNAVEAAQSVLENQRRFVLNKKQWDAVTAALEAPARVLPNLQKALAEADAWDARDTDKFDNKQP
jgi:uncharacterized protein (DUF1778 family)